MIQGLDTFKAFFAGLEDRYTLIGGVACYLSMEEAGIDFRATKDLDIVLCAETLDAGFVQRFWDFVKAGEYEHQEKSSGDKQFYRFTKPNSTDYPFMLELFSRKPEELLLAVDNDLTNLTKFSTHSLSLGAKRPLKVWVEMDSVACVEQAYVLSSILLRCPA